MLKPKEMEARLFPMRLVRVGLVVLAATSLCAQEPPPPTFRTSTQLVQVDVVVKAKDRAVQGLTKDDFEVFDNGQRQSIAVFSVRDAETVKAVAPKLAPGVVSNRPPTIGREPVSATIVLIDSLNTAPEDQAYARQQVLKYLNTAPRSEWVAIQHLHADLDVLQDFTLDREKLKAALAKWKPTNEYLQPTDPPKITMNALKIIARHMQGLDGRKKLIWLTSANFPAMMNAMSQGTATVRDMYDVKSFNIIGAFNAANVAIYALDPRGICTGTFATCPGLMDDGIQPMQQVAEATGGKAFYMRNDIAAGIGEAIQDTDLTYTLGFYPPQVDTSGLPHALRVNVKRSGVESRYRSQYATEPVRDKPLNTKERTGTINAWVQMPLDSTDIPIQASASPLQTRPGMYQVSISFDVSALKLVEKNGKFEGSIEIGIVPDVEKKPKGLRQTLKISYTPERLAQALEKGAKVTNVVKGLNDRGKPLAKAFHVVIMDNSTGKAGSVRVPITVEQAKR